MELIDQHTKKIMEGCKERARAAGLRFQDETLEYIVTNRDLIELSPKVMIPTLYDYWVQDVEVLKEKGRYELYPGNPYETVINTRPAISFYNDNNPDWLNVMIFYHVLGHIDFFQNNLYFRHTWEYDFTGQALSDKRMIAALRAEKGRWVDYVIEFSRGIDNLVGFHRELSPFFQPEVDGWSKMIDYYFDVFLQEGAKQSVNRYVKEIERFNECTKKYGDMAEQTFFTEIHQKYPEFITLFQKSLEEKKSSGVDLLRFLMEESAFLNKEDNKWMLSVMEVIRNTSLYFQPQIRTKIMNEGWASYWHETLFLQDDRIQGHEANFAKTNAGVTAMPRVGLNPYALGMRLFYHLEDAANRGQYSFDFQRIKDTRQRKEYNAATDKGREFIFSIRENLSDFNFVNTFIDQDFVSKNKLFVAGKRLNPQRMAWQYYVKSRKARDYKQMVIESLYHPPDLRIELRPENNTLYLNHLFEGKPLIREYIANTLIGVGFLWGGRVQLETSEVAAQPPRPRQDPMGGPSRRAGEDQPEPKISWQRVLYTMENKQVTKKRID
ncbi:MAG: SpoVR family protein [Desulfobulbaceae bacterium]|nr:SpoVR family protein [Desulfobulbaceae bacterium]